MLEAFVTWSWLDNMIIFCLEVAGDVGIVVGLDVGFQQSNALVVSHKHKRATNGPEYICEIALKGKGEYDVLYWLIQRQTLKKARGPSSFKILFQQSIVPWKHFSIIHEKLT